MRLEVEERSLNDSPNKWNDSVTVYLYCENYPKEAMAEDVRECFGER